MKSLFVWMPATLFGIGLWLSFPGSAGAQDFPQSWYGQWRGPLLIRSAQGTTQTVAMQLDIGPIDADRASFVITYTTGNQIDTRAYELITVDAKRGQYVVDEKNGIRINQYRLGNRLLCQFDLATNRLQTAYELTGPNTLTFEVMTSGPLPGSSASGPVPRGQAAPSSVSGYPANGFQRAVLQRQ
ncbi:hypothetical protein [Spirosoma sp. 209]|uniref:hypothetical protein n=1 Tax=Spirosoma sp. 209 TaxID=1955701 RepID=UPI00098D6332|nr:hypothetical protein [Spirosoma sp. 209]